MNNNIYKEVVNTGDKQEIKKCGKCNGDMVEGLNEGSISIYHNNRSAGTKTKAFMCTDCGYIETYGVNPQQFK